MMLIHLIALTSALSLRTSNDIGIKWSGKDMTNMSLPLLRAKFMVNNHTIAVMMSKQSDARQELDGFWWPIGSSCYVDTSNVTMDQRYNSSWGCLGLYSVPHKYTKWTMGNNYTVLAVFDHPSAADNFSVFNSHITVPGPSYIPVSTAGRLQVKEYGTELTWTSSATYHL